MTRKLGSLFSGTTALDLAAAEVLGVEPAWFSDIDPGACALLAHHYPNVPNLGDITTVDWDQVEPVWALTGGFPCTDVSTAGKQAGLKPDTRSGLWNQMAYAITKLRPQVVLIENVRGLASAEAHSDVEPCPWCLGDQRNEPALRALGAVLGDLAVRGYDAVWRGLPASDVGACHARFRFFVLAYAANTAGELGVERWASAPRQAESRRTLGEPGRRGLRTTADPNGAGSQGPESARRRDLPSWGRCCPSQRSRTPGGPGTPRQVGRRVRTTIRGRRFWTCSGLGPVHPRRPTMGTNPRTTCTCADDDWRPRWPCPEPGLAGVDDGASSGLDHGRAWVEASATTEVGRQRRGEAASGPRPAGTACRRPSHPIPIRRVGRSGMTSQPEPFIQDRGEEAVTVLSQPGPVTAAEALALAVLRGEIVAPVVDENDGGA